MLACVYGSVLQSKKLPNTVLSLNIQRHYIHTSMLLLFAQICHEHERGTISKTEFAFFSYQIRRTLAHKQFKQYLFDFAEYCGKYKIGYPYLSLAREGLNVDALHYDKVLSFVDKKRIKFQNKLKDVLP